MKIPKGKLKKDGSSNDDKRMFIVHKSNDGYEDLRIEIDTDDCDKSYAEKIAREIIRRWNSFEE